MFDQSPFACKLEWGQRGAREAAERGDLIIVVDVLSFSSTVTTAAEYGAVIYPYPPPVNEHAHRFAEEIGARMVWGRAESEKFGGPSLSPLTFLPSDEGHKFVMCSLNGAACTWAATKTAAVIAGCLRNASAVAAYANEQSAILGADITVVPCGEQWNDPAGQENRLRPGIEDYLAAGLILSKLNGSKSPEAQVCAGAYEYSRLNVAELIYDSGSGRELRQRGYEADVTHCIETDRSSAVPVLEEGRFMDKGKNRSAARSE